MSDRIQLIGEESIPNVDAFFLRKLHMVDPDLHVEWNTKRKRWTIQQCSEHHPAADGSHTNICRRTTFLICQDDDGDMIPLSEAIIAKILEMRHLSESFGGATERGLLNFKRELKYQEQKHKEKRENDIKEIYRLNSLDNKRQLEQVRTLIQNHF